MRSKLVSVDEEAKNACPMCREPNFTSFPNIQIEGVIKSLHVFCTNKASNKGKGCNWQGEINCIDDHLASSCQFEEASCYKKCGLVLQRRQLSKHVETECSCCQITCEYCNTTSGERRFIRGDHKEECPNFPLPYMS